MPVESGAAWSIRPVASRDESRWLELYSAYARFYDEPLTPARAESAWEWVSDPDGPVRCLMAVDDQGVVAALAHYRPFPRPLSGGWGCYLDDLFVDPARRGQGAADALLVELARLARVNGWGVVRWITANGNGRARAKYDQYAAATSWVTYDMPVARSSA